VIQFNGPAGALESVISAPGTTVPNTTSSTQYDSSGRVVQTTDPYGRIRTTTYNAKGAVVQTRQQTYDGLGQLKYLVSRTVYDDFGRTVLATDSYLEGSADPIYGSQTLYDSLGRVTSSVRRVGVAVQLNGSETSTTALGTIVSQSFTQYDSQGRAFQQIAADGQISITEFNALGDALVRAGHPVCFAPCVKLVQHLLAAKKALQLPQWLSKLGKFPALIIDDLGYVQQNREEMEVLFTLIADRYERSSILLSSNLPFSKWESIFKDPMTTAAAIDRLVHHSVILELNVPSFRLEQASKDRASQDRNASS
jgi:YD repeat-containing protein